MKVLGAGEEITVSGHRDRRIAAIAKAQRGRVATRQLRAAGLSSGVVSRLVASHWLIPVQRAVFAVGHTAPMPLVEETAALLAVGDDSLLSHFSASALWDLTLPGVGDGRVHVSSPKDHRVSLQGAVSHRTRILEPRDRRVRHGLPVVSPARALLDIASDCTLRQLELAFDRGVVMRVLRPSEVADVLDRARGHRGRRRLRLILHRDAPGSTMTRSEAEERMLALIRSARLPEPILNAEVCGYEVDFLWPQHRFALEIDGFRFHTTRSAFERDRTKDLCLRGEGLTTARATWRMVQEEPTMVLVDIVRGLYGR